MKTIVASGRTITVTGKAGAFPKLSESSAAQRFVRKIADAEKTVQQINSGLVGWHEDALPEALAMLAALNSMKPKGKVG